MSALAPVIYLPHGGGPMPLLGDPSHADLIRFLQTLPERFARPRAVVLVSAHWEAPLPSVYLDEAPSLLFDYYGFPPQTYEYRYPAPGDPELAETIQGLLAIEGISSSAVEGRGFDHGMFVPMMLLWPEADMPCVQLSLIKGLDPERHLQLGEALQELRRRNVAIIGSGMSFHNLQALFAQDQSQLRQASADFNQWLIHTMSGEADDEARRAALAAWEGAPWARFSHPREEHLLPLHVCAGAAACARAEVIYNAPLMGHNVSGFGWF
jgi:4,5-DOPA dioxygenase extradiol